MVSVAELLVAAALGAKVQAPPSVLEVGRMLLPIAL